MTSIVLSPIFKQILELLECGSDHLFITGRAGTGKSTLLTHFHKNTTLSHVVLAPTGVAAVNVGGATIHSFFGFKPNITLDKAWSLGSKTKKAKLYQNLDLIIIDEISMVRADLLDCVDAFLRRVCASSKPFGGKRVVFFGDLYQLPPVVTRDEEGVFKSRYASPYFFSADVMSRVALTYIELDHIYRQSDTDFIEVLNALREGVVNQSHLSLLNTRLSPDYSPPPEEYIINLTGTNQTASDYNTYQLNSLDGVSHDFYALTTGRFDSRTEPAPRELVLKIGAQVMLTANDPDKRFVNGTVGRVEEISWENSLPIVSVRLKNKKLVDVAPTTWEMFSFDYNEKSRRISSDVVGTYTQLPLMLAWAVTIHKAQGKTFERVIIDLPQSFAHGQTYVALSRATSLSGLYLRRPLTPRHIIMDKTVTSWLTLMRETCSILSS